MQVARLLMSHLDIRSLQRSCTGQQRCRQEWNPTCVPFEGGTKCQDGWLGGREGIASP